MLVKRVVWFLCFMFLLLFVYLVLFVSILKNSFVLFCFCVFLSQDQVVFLFASCGPSSVSVFCCFVLNFVFFVFSFLSKKDPPKHRTQQKPKKAKIQKKTDKKNQLAQLCSQLVFFNLLGWA